MVTKPRSGIALVASGALLVLAATAMDVAAEEGGDGAAVDWSARAKAAWGKTCQKCHAVPDARFETDRAFLGQILETI